jgi:hypothetical protein
MFVAGSRYWTQAILGKITVQALERQVPRKVTVSIPATLKVVLQQLNPLHSHSSDAPHGAPISVPLVVSNHEEPQQFITVRGDF